MHDLLQLIGFFAVAAAFSFALSYGIARALGQRRMQVLVPGCSVRLRTSDGVYRTRYAGPSPQGLVFAAPLKRDSYVPISVGAPVTVEAPSHRGVLLFRTRVASRDAATHEFVLAAPDRVFHEDRRQSPRLVKGRAAIRVEEQTAWLADASETGFRFYSDAAFGPGERVRIDLPEQEEPEFAWVLHCGPNLEGGKGAYSIRARRDA